MFLKFPSDFKISMSYSTTNSIPSTFSCNSSTQISLFFVSFMMISSTIILSMIIFLQTQLQSMYLQESILSSQFFDYHIVALTLTQSAQIIRLRSLVYGLHSKLNNAEHARSLLREENGFIQNTRNRHQYCSIFLFHLRHHLVSFASLSYRSCVSS